LLDGMHYRGLLRVARRERGIRVYAAQDTREAIRDPELRRARLDALIDVLVRVYAPLPRVTLAWLVRRLRDAAPQWTGELGAALTRTRERLSRATVDGIEWYWPADEHISEYDSDFDRVRLLTPFDPLVWDRTRFEALWGWAYRFEAYTPVAKRKLGYYALPLLWQDRVIGWGNVNVAAGELDCQLGFVKAHPKQRSFARALEADLAALKRFVAAG
jgi:hypothetical protein